MSGFVKIYGKQLLGSSLMDADVSTRWLFMCLLSAADESGYVRCQTVGNASRLANITPDEAERGLEALSSPDPLSTTPDHDGRRILRVEGGWKIVNAQKYRDIRTPTQIKNAERLAEWRSRQGVTCNTSNVTRNRSNAASREVSNSPSNSVVYVEGGVGGDPSPPAERAEKAVTDNVDSLQLQLGALLAQCAEHPNSRLLVPAWSAKVTSYTKGDKEVGGRQDFRMIRSPERLQRSIEDAKSWLKAMDEGEVVHGRA